MLTLIYNSTSFLLVTHSQCGKAFVLLVTPVTLLVPGVNIPPHSHRFKRLIYTKTLVNKYHLLNLYYLLIYSSSLLVQFHCLVLI